jgi:hypothetical protein
MQKLKNPNMTVDIEGTYYELYDGYGVKNYHKTIDEAEFADAVIEGLNSNNLIHDDNNIFRKEKVEDKQFMNDFTIMWDDQRYKEMVDMLKSLRPGLWR